MLFDLNGKNGVIKKLGGMSCPYTVLINKDGTIYSKHLGYERGDEIALEKEIQELIDYNNTTPLKVEAKINNGIPSWYTTPPKDDIYVYAVATSTSSRMQMVVNKATLRAQIQFGNGVQEGIETVETHIELEKNEDGRPVYRAYVLLRKKQISE